MIRRYLILLCLVCLPVLAQPQIEVAFSPDGEAEQLVLDTIASAKQTICMAAYSFTSPKIMKQLIAARKRGVDVRIVIDDKGNRSKASKAAMNLIVNAGISLRTVSKWKIHHDKYMIVDGKTVKTGSFNYSKSAAESNSENILVIRNNPKIAEQYLQHWQSRWNAGTDWVSEY